MHTQDTVSWAAARRAAKSADRDQPDFRPRQQPARHDALLRTPVGTLAQLPTAPPSASTTSDVASGRLDAPRTGEAGYLPPPSGVSNIGASATRWVNLSHGTTASGRSPSPAGRPCARFPQATEVHTVERIGAAIHGPGGRTLVKLGRHNRGDAMGLTRRWTSADASGQPQP